jgi:hypothetical protein
MTSEYRTRERGKERKAKNVQGWKIKKGGTKTQLDGNFFTSEKFF